MPREVAVAVPTRGDAGRAGQSGQTGAGLETFGTDPWVVALFQGSSDAPIVTRGDRILHTNPAAAAQFGADAVRALIGRSVRQLVPPDARAQIIADLQTARTGAAPTTPPTTRRWRTLHGQDFEAETRTYAVTVEDERALLVQVRDLTERRMIERALRDSVAQQADSVERLARGQYVGNFGSWETDRGTRNVAWSAQTHVICETDPATCCPTYSAVLVCIPAEERRAAEDALQASIATGTGGEIEHRIMTSTGRVKSVHERWQVFAGTAHGAERIVGTCADVTERKRAEIARQASGSRWQFAIEGSGDGLWDWDVATDTVHWSRQGKEMLGYADEEIGHAGGKWEHGCTRTMPDHQPPRERRSWMAHSRTMRPNTASGTRQAIGRGC